MKCFNVLQNNSVRTCTCKSDCQLSPQLQDLVTERHYLHFKTVDVDGHNYLTLA